MLMTRPYVAAIVKALAESHIAVGSRLGSVARSLREFPDEIPSRMNARDPAEAVRRFHARLLAEPGFAHVGILSAYARVVSETEDIPQAAERYFEAIGNALLGGIMLSLDDLSPAGFVDESWLRGQLDVYGREYEITPFNPQAYTWVSALLSLSGISAVKIDNFYPPQVENFCQLVLTEGGKVLFLPVGPIDTSDPTFYIHVGNWTPKKL